MTLLSGLFPNHPTEKRSLSFQQVWGSDLQTSNSIAGVRVSQDTSLNYVTTYACVRLLAESVASLPIDTFVKIKGQPRPLRAPAWLDRPNSEQTPFEFLERVMASLLLWGNAYLLIVADDLGQVLELWPLDPSKVRVERDRASNELLYLVGNERLSRSEVVHIRAFGVAGSDLGLSPIAVGRQAIAAGMATDAYASGFWANGARPSGLLSVPGEPDEDDVERISRAWNVRHGGPTNSQRTAVLTGGASYSAISMPAEESQFLQTRSFQVTEIARLFRVPPHMIQDLERSTYSNIEHQGIDFVTHTLRPWLKRIEDQLSLLLGPNAYAKFNERALLRGDSKTQAESFRIAWEHGWMNTDEIREKLDLEPLEGGKGEGYFAPLNMARVDAKPEQTLTEKVQAASRLISAGFEPQDVLDALGLPPMTHTGHIPSTLLPDKALPETDGDTNV